MQAAQRNFELLWEAGDRIRVLPGEKDGSARRAVMVHIHDMGSADIVYDDTKDDDQVPLSRIRRLEDFEIASRTSDFKQIDCDTVEAVKLQGNVLFGLADHFAAAEHYGIAIDKLALPNSNTVSIDVKRAIVTHGKKLWAAQIDVRHKSASLKFLCRVGQIKGDIRRQRRPAARSVPLNQALAVHEGVLGALQVNLYLNRARCWLHLGQSAKTVQDCILAIALLEASSTRLPLGRLLDLRLVVLLLPVLLSALWVSRQVKSLFWVGCCVFILICLMIFLPMWRSWRSRNSGLKPLDTRSLCKAYFLKARAHLARKQFSSAERDALTAEVLAEQEQMSQVEQLRREVSDARRDKQWHEQEAAKWCDKAMANMKPDAFGTFDFEDSD